MPSGGNINLYYQGNQEPRFLKNLCNSWCYLAERGGFEPPLVQALNRISNPAHSTTLPSLRIVFPCKAGLGRERAAF